jgi:hypothetical protein
VLPSVIDGTYALTLSMPPWEEAIPSVAVSSGKAFIVDHAAAPAPLGTVELQRGHRLVTGTKNDVLFDVSPDGKSLVYRQYAMSSGTASFVAAAGGPPGLLATGWLSQTFFVENGRRVALVSMAGDTLVNASIDLVEPGTGVRTPLATGVMLEAGVYLFAPERLGYYVGSNEGRDLVIERLDLGDHFVVKNVNNVWKQSRDKSLLAVYTPGAGLRIVNLATGTVQPVSSIAVRNFDFTPDGHRIVFDDQTAIYGADVATGTVTTLAEGEEYLLSPDGRFVLVQQSIGAPQLVRTTDSSTVTTTSEVASASVSTTTFSVDGAYMFFQAANAFEATSTSTIDEQILANGTNGRLVDYVPTTKTVYFTMDGAFVQGSGQSKDLFRAPLGGGPRETLATRLGSFSGPFASAGGRYVVYAVPDAAARLILTAIDTMTGVRMPLAYVMTGAVTFSPDEKWLLLVDASGIARIARLSDGQSYPIAPGPALASNAKFSPSGDRVMFTADGVLVTAPVEPCPLPTFIARNVDSSGARWVGDRALAFFRAGVSGPFSFANGLYLAPVP